MTREQANTDAMAILTPEQRPEAVELLTTLPETVKVPPVLQASTPLEIVQRVRSQASTWRVGRTKCGS